MARTLTFVVVLLAVAPLAAAGEVIVGWPEGVPFPSGDPREYAQATSEFAMGVAGDALADATAICVDPTDPAHPNVDVGCTTTPQDAAEWVFGIPSACEPGDEEPEDPVDWDLPERPSTVFDGQVDEVLRGVAVSDASAVDRCVAWILAGP